MSTDLDKLMAVMEAAFDPAWGEAWTRQQVSDSLTFPHTHYALVDAAGDWPALDTPAGGFTLVRAAPGEEELLLIAVRPEDRGRGLGQRLLEAAKQAARGRGADALFLEMRVNNPAHSLYRACGFNPIGQRPDYYRVPDGSRVDAITFSCQL